MNEEAIKELAQQLGKGVNWVTDTLLPYVYNYAEYKIAIAIVGIIVAGIVSIVGAVLLVKAAKIRTNPKYSRYDDGDKLFTVLSIGILCTVVGLIVVFSCVDSILSWSIAPEITFIENMTNES